MKELNDGKEPATNEATEADKKKKKVKKNKDKKADDAVPAPVEE